MAEKELLTNCASVGIIYRASDPSQVLMEVKDAGYPRKSFVGMGCFIGGNWVGEAAKNDMGPMDTFLREVEEELSFSNALVDPLELHQLHGATDVDINGRRSETTPLPQDQDDLMFLVKEIRRSAVPYRTFVVTVPEKVFRIGEPNYSRGDSAGLISYYKVALSEDAWVVLERLQKKFGNLSNESVTIITSLEEMIKTGFKISWGHDRVLRQFFGECLGYVKVKKLPMVSGITTVYLGVPANSYRKYLERFDFKLTPWTKTK